MQYVHYIKPYFRKRRKRKKRERKRKKRIKAFENICKIKKKDFSVLHTLNNNNER